MLAKMDDEMKPQIVHWAAHYVRMPGDSAVLLR